MEFALAHGLVPERSLGQMAAEFALVRVLVYQNYAHADKLDSVMVLAEADGDNAESYRYKEFGEQTVVDSSFAKLTVLSSNIGNWKRYTGQEHALPSTVSDPWYFYRARVYRADAGRFVQRDGLGYVDSSNAYSYVQNSPTNRVDPLGYDDSVANEPMVCRTKNATCKNQGTREFRDYKACMDFNIADSDPFFNDTLCAGTVCVYCERDQEGELIPVTFCCSLSCDEDGNVQGSRGSSSTPGASVYDEHYGSSGEGCAEVFGNYQDVGTGNQWDDLDRHEYNQGIVTATGFGFAAGAAGAVITGAGAPAAGGVGIVTGLGSGLTVASAGPSGHETKCCP